MNRCGHEGPSRRVCVHLSADPDADELDYAVLIDGSVDYALICLSCRDKPPATLELVCLCEACFAEQEAERYWEEDVDGVSGTFTPQIVDDVVFETVCTGDWDGADTIGAAYDEGWLVYSNTALGRIGHGGEVKPLSLPAEVERWRQSPRDGVSLSVDARGRYAAIVDIDGGLVWELESGEVVLRPAREDYHSEQTWFPIAFLRRHGRDFVAHACAWNEVRLFDLDERRACTGATPEQDRLDYFFGALYASPDGTRMASTGWVWHPVGLICVWDVLEHEPITRARCHFMVQRSYSWDGPFVWLDRDRVAVWGFGNDDLNLVDAVCIYESQTGELEKIVPGVPSGRLAFDGHLLYCASESDGVSVWDVQKSVRVAHDPAQHAIPDSSGHVLTFAEGTFAILRLRG